MKQLYLASSIESTAGHIAKKISLQGFTLKALKAAFIYTAGEIEDDQRWIDADRDGFKNAGITTFDYTITGKTLKDLERDLGNCDLIHVNGGNTYYLLLQAKKSGFDKFIKKRADQGIIYSGSSAGSMIAGSNIAITWRPENKPYVKDLPDTLGFNLVDFTIFPHWGSSRFKKIFFSYRLRNAYKKGNKIILLNDDQYVEIIDGNYKIVDVTKD